MVERVRAVLAEWRNVRETPALGGLVFEWDGDPLVGVVDDELIVRAQGGGWATVTGDVGEWVDRAAKVVLAKHAVTCLGHVGRIDREVLPEVVPRLRELLGDPQLGGWAEDALGDIDHFVR